MALNRDYDPLFARFWAAYPRRENKPAAEREFLKLKLNEAEVNELIRHIEYRKKADRAWLPNEKGNTFVPYAERFLKNRRWEDEFERVKTGPMQQKRSYDVEPVPERGGTRTEAVARRAFEILKGLVH